MMVIVIICVLSLSIDSNLIDEDSFLPFSNPQILKFLILNPVSFNTRFVSSSATAQAQGDPSIKSIKFINQTNLSNQSIKSIHHFIN